MPFASPPQTLSPGFDRYSAALDRFSQAQQLRHTQAEHLRIASERHLAKFNQDHAARWSAWWQQWLALGGELTRAAMAGQLSQDVAEYTVDAAQRALLTVDILRERADLDMAHEAAGTPPVLKYDYELIMDGRALPRPVNYQLLQITPPDDVEVFDWKRPYMIIDPRAGHGAGIGGFKPDSQVGVALRGGHPVYFVVFRPHPEPGQVLADVMRAEAEFVREIARRHPESPQPIVVGNCQGGWASLILAAANPEITGPLVINGAPTAYWSGQLGNSPMRYKGGLNGGIVPALLMSDLGGGEFDGAYLVNNFEMLNPGRNFFGKYFDLYRNPEQMRQGFLEFEKWWGGFHFMSEAEIRWIIENLFVGNRLSRGEAYLEHGRPLDLKAIRSPIIVFASHGDNITPPAQALHWIVDTYADENEIKIHGQRIIYMVHDKVGHLGIFVSSSIAKKEHQEMASTLKTIEALAPGLYEMTIEDIHGDVQGDGYDAAFVVNFRESTLDDIVRITGGERAVEKDLAAVARLSEMGADVYEIAARPLVQSLVTPQSARLLREAHPSRVSRRVFSGQNPVMQGVKLLAGGVQQQRQRAKTDNPLLGFEKLWAEGVIQAMDIWRDLRDASDEMKFLAIYGTPSMRRVGQSHDFERTHKTAAEMRDMPVVRAAILGMKSGGFAAAVIRMLILLAESRGAVRRDRLERSSEVLSQREPFSHLTPEERAALIREQSLIVEYEHDKAIATLPLLLPLPEQRQEALAQVHYIIGSRDEMAEASRKVMAQLEEVLDSAAPAPEPPPAPARKAPVARKKAAMA